jgi:hypothetical protein
MTVRIAKLCDIVFFLRQHFVSPRANKYLTALLNFQHNLRWFIAMKIHFFMVTDIFLGVGIWTQGLVLAKKALYTWAMTPVLFALGIFQIESRVYVWAGLDWDPPIYATCVAGVTGMNHFAQLFTGWDGVSLTFSPRISSHWGPPNLSLLSS